jgi:acetyl-CoA carboxylase/biotin carboxylase 1
MINGRESPQGVWEDGFFDRGSFQEILYGWAQTVVVGRARLGGIPVGVIAVETRTVELIIPADPANLDSETKVVSQAGQVWFPDSAYKTAQAIMDFNREDLPLIIFANWRGFSGGMKDMYDQVVKFGAYIVDALREYKQPILVYIPPFAELRGGAWAVLDATINPRHMEMYADPDARGGVLEPEGTVEIRFRSKDLVRTMHRCDITCKKMAGELSTTTDPDARRKLEQQLKDRETQLMGMYHQTALFFADLHDKPQRMLEKGVICDIIPWQRSRYLLYWRLRRLLYEDRLKNEIQSIITNIGDGEMLAMIRRWFIEHHGQHNQYLFDENRCVAEWLHSQFESSTSLVLENIACLKRDAVSRKMQSIFAENTSVAFDSLLQLVHSNISQEQRLKLLTTLTNMDGTAIESNTSSPSISQASDSKGSEAPASTESLPSKSKSSDTEQK